jgi:heme-degrading monooxygenase HmoA
MNDPGPVVAIFRSTRTSDDEAGYREWSARLESLVAESPGYLSHESFRDATTRRGITIAYFSDEEALRAWGTDATHRDAQQLGRSSFYEAYSIEIARVVRSRSWSATAAVQSTRADADPLKTTTSD